MNILKKLFNKNKPEKELYYYVTSFTVINEQSGIIEYMEFDKKMTKDEKQKLRRGLLKLNPNSTVKVKGRYQRYRSEC